MKIFLDDNGCYERDPKAHEFRIVPREWTIAKTKKEFLGLLEAHAAEVEVISFDHDLGYDEPDGRRCAEHMLQYAEDMVNLKEIKIHTANPVGADNLRAKLATARQSLAAVSRVTEFNTIAPFSYIKNVTNKALEDTK